MDNLLPILAIETSGELCSIALMESEEIYWEVSVRKKHVHSEKIFSLIDAALTIANKQLIDLKSIAVSMGPGSFTGLRIGLSAAKGIAMGASLPIIPVPTFESLALELGTFLNPATNFVISNSVNSTEIYFAKYKAGINTYEIVNELELANKENLKDKLNKNDLVYGSYNPERNNSFYSSPSAKSVAKWGYFFGKDLVTFEYDFLEPNYLKKFIAKVKK